jgi:DNA invertase Pin-like site-specific DNA recombinase
VSDVILGSTGEVISRKEQKALIEAHARDAGIEVVAWFEDEQYCEGLMERPGVRQMLACDKEFDTVLVERVWSLSRRWGELQPLLAGIAAMGKSLEAATTLWDCVSQMARNPRLLDSAATCPLPRSAEETQAVLRIRKPRQLNFFGLKRASRGA